MREVSVMQRRSAARRRWAGEQPSSTEGKPGIFRNKRVMAIGAAVLAFAALPPVTQISSAPPRRKQGGKNTACPTTAPPATTKATSPAAKASASASASANESSDAADPAAGDVPKAG